MNVVVVFVTCIILLFPPYKSKEGSEDLHCHDHIPSLYCAFTRRIMIYSTVSDLRDYSKVDSIEKAFALHSLLFYENFLV